MGQPRELGGHRRVAPAGFGIAPDRGASTGKTKENGFWVIHRAQFVQLTFLGNSPEAFQGNYSLVSRRSSRQNGGIRPSGR
jgi:hypothetical protein